MQKDDPILFRISGEPTKFAPRCLWILPDRNKQTYAVCTLEVGEIEADGMRTVTGKVIEITADMADAVTFTQVYSIDHDEYEHAWYGDMNDHVWVSLPPKHYAPVSPRRPDPPDDIPMPRYRL